VAGAVVQAGEQLGGPGRVEQDDIDAQPVHHPDR